MPRGRRIEGMEPVAAIELDGQYRALREGAGVVDRSSRGKLVVRGAEAAEYLESQLTNEVEALAAGEGCYAALLDRKGHIQADLRALRLAPDALWLDTEAAASERLRKHLETYKIGRDVEIADVSAEQAIVALIGPAAREIAGTGPLAPEFAHREVAWGRAVATDLGVDLLVGAPDAERVRAGLREAGAAEVTEQAAEILRVE